MGLIFRFIFCCVNFQNPRRSIFVFFLPHHDYGCMIGISKKYILVLFLILLSFKGDGQSIAREWNEALLVAIRNDFARPTVHARNLFHISAAMYDAWAVYDDAAKTYLLGDTLYEFKNSFLGLPINELTLFNDQEKAISYAAYRLISHRFKDSPGILIINSYINDLMEDHGYNTSYTSTVYSSGNAAALGNYIAKTYIDYGLQDGSNESNEYANKYYKPLNNPLNPRHSGTSSISFPNNWQPLSFEEFIDQSGNSSSDNTPTFISAEWGDVLPFALDGSVKTTYLKNGNEWNVYHDPSPPCFIYPNGDSSDSEVYQWGFAMVAKWSSHLNPDDDVIWDISPASIGNITEYPRSFEDYKKFYDEDNGGDNSKGHIMNPYTDAPYAPQLVKRGDYTRVLAEFWADGPDSETPPGHWFTILNYVNDHELSNRQFQGIDEPLSELEWDIKAYFSLGAAMHDAAVSAWSIKGYYDYIRPISAIRYMCELGQCSDKSLSNYHPAGIPLDPGFIEVIDATDDLAGTYQEYIGWIKLNTWTGGDPLNGVNTGYNRSNWVLAGNWWPYQMPSFVTPPFAGYVSGHSTFSSAAAVVLTLLTGDGFFPGGIAEFKGRKNLFLTFENGPSEDVTLSWATYQDAADQCGLSRIWGGIHPPIDDIPGRKIGKIIGENAFEKAKTYFTDGKRYVEETVFKEISNLYPNIIKSNEEIVVKFKDPSQSFVVRFFNLNGKLHTNTYTDNKNQLVISTIGISPGLYMVQVYSDSNYNTHKVIIY